MAEKQVTEDGQSYQKYNVLLFRDLASRAGNTPTKDEQYLNVVPEIVLDRNIGDTRQFLLKRAGTAELISSQTANEVRGIFFWEDYNKLIYCASNNIYVYNFNTSVLTTISAPFTTTTGVVGFTEFLYDSGGVVVIASDGTKLISIDASNTVVTCADPDLPSPHLPYPIFMDGYIFLAKASSSDIYNSNLNDPMLWTPGDFISAEMSPDLLIRIAKINNYLIAFGTESIEYFWDAANPSGSPLQRNDTPIKLNTYLAGFAQYGNDILYIGKNNGGQASVFMISDFKVNDIGTATISRYLNFVSEDQTTWQSGLLASQGHTTYLLSVGNLTYVYDFDTKIWGKWAYQQSANFPINYHARVTNSNVKFSVFSFKGNSSAIYAIKDSYTQDGSTNFTSQIITEQASFGTLNRKSMSRLSIVGDRTPGSSYLTVSWSDDDYQTWSTPRSIQLSQDLQSTYRLGSFRQRAFKIEYTDSYIFRIQTIECDINKGIS